MFLSFVVPVYNAAQYLPECLDSLLAQDISDYEIICVNDGSRDASPEILRQYAAKHGNIRVIDKENGGVVSARNAGLSAAQGDFIWFVDADDFLLPNILGFLRNKAAETACDRLIVGGYQFTDRLTDEEIALSRQMKLPINSQWAVSLPPSPAVYADPCLHDPSDRLCGNISGLAVPPPAHPLGLLPDVAPAAPRAVEASLSRPGEKRLAYQNHTFSGCIFPTDGV